MVRQQQSWRGGHGSSFRRPPCNGGTRPCLADTLHRRRSVCAGIHQFFFCNDSSCSARKPHLLFPYIRHTRNVREKIHEQPSMDAPTRTIHVLQKIPIGSVCVKVTDKFHLQLSSLGVNVRCLPTSKHRRRNSISRKSMVRSTSPTRRPAAERSPSRRGPPRAGGQHRPCDTRARR